MRNKNILTQKEEALLEVLWEYGKPITGNEILKLQGMEHWSETGLYRTIKSLLDKKLIEICGVEQYKTQYARKLQPTLTREEYAVQSLMEKGMNTSSISKIALALVKRLKVNEKEETDRLIMELEEIVEKLREDRGCK